MAAELDGLAALMPFAAGLGLVLDEASADRGRTTVTVQTSLTSRAGKLVAQTTQIQAIR
jgi:hypothetical protein